jgi:hypothetical protein
MRAAIGQDGMPVVKGSAVSGRGWLVLGAAGYVACFNWMYVRYLNPEFASFGFDYIRPPTAYLVAAWTLAILPSLWMPLRLVRPSQLVYWTLYVTVIIPSMFVPLYAGLNPPTEVIWLVITLFVGFAMVGLSYAVPIRRFARPSVPPQLFWSIVIAIAALLAAWMLAVYRKNLHILSFADIYDLRDAASEMAEGSQVNYAFMLISGAVGPFLMAYGLFYRKWWCFASGACSQLLIYSIGGTKGSILSILFIPGMYILLTRSRRPFGMKFLLGAITVIGLSCVSYVMVGGEPGLLHAMALFVILLRTLSINGLATAQYYDFFTRNPLTYYSHLHFVSWFIQYPYKYPIGVEVGLRYSGDLGLDATGHFWAMDGLAALGLPGILVISVGCACVFWLLDSVASRHVPELTALMITYAAYNVANIGLFTSLLSGGLSLLILAFYYMPTCKPRVRASLRLNPASGNVHRSKLRAAPGSVS